MNRNNKQLKTISVPHRLFESMLEAYQKWEKFNNEFEDFMLSEDEQFIQKMRKARREHLAGKASNLKILKQEL